MKADITVDDLRRADGRPEAYDVPPDFAGSPCALCTMEGKIGLRYKHGEIFMSSPADAVDAESHLVCKGHLPANVVIFNPQTNTCRNKEGTDTWREPDNQVSFRPVGHH